MAKEQIKILAVFGTRPDAIKMAPVVMELASNPRVRLFVAVTGQHREMLDQVLSVFGIKPDYDLAIMQERQTLMGITMRALDGLDKVIGEIKPDMVLAQGDTTTTFAAALAAFYHKTAFGHVEAGLRTKNKFNPFPEEMNRRLTGAIADIHFAPTEGARQNLLAEGVPDSAIVVTGNTVIDALLKAADIDYKFDNPILQEITKSEGRLILVTAHRRESWGEPIRNICSAVRELVNRYDDVRVVFSMHKNPIVREIVTPALGSVERVYLIEPPDYVPFVHLMKAAKIILTDSGGVQEEAPSLGKPVLVLRETTERTEGVAAGCAKLVGVQTDKIISETSKLLDDSAEYEKMARAVNPYGDGMAAKRITKAIFDYFDSRKQ